MNENILLVDDDKTPLKAIKAMLKAANYGVVVKRSSHAALCTFREHPFAFDAIIADELIDGRVLSTALLRNVLMLRSDIPILLCTEDAELIRREAISVGIRWFVPKPVTFLGLLNIVRGALKKRSLMG